MSDAFVTTKMCYVYNQWYDISCTTLYAYMFLSYSGSKICIFKNKFERQMDVHNLRITSLILSKPTIRYAQNLLLSAFVTITPWP